MLRPNLLLALALLMIGCGQQRSDGAIALVQRYLEQPAQGKDPRLASIADPLLRRHRIDGRTHGTADSEPVYLVSGVIDPEESLFASFHANLRSGEVSLKTLTLIPPAGRAMDRLVDLRGENGGREFPGFPSIPDASALQLANLNPHSNGWAAVINDEDETWIVLLDNELRVIDHGSGKELR